MKLFELYERRPLREDKTLTASIKLCESVIKLLEGMNDAGTKYGVYSKGGSIGSKKDGKPVATFDKREDAMAKAKSMRKGLTKGEKGHYKMGYSVKPIKENFEYEPDPAFAGVKGVTRDTGAGEQERKAAEHKQQHAKVNQTWQKLVGNLRKLDFTGAEKLKVNLKKFAIAAKKNGVQLTPSPEDVLG